MRLRTTSVKPLTPDEIDAENVDLLFLIWLLSRSTHDLLDTVLASTGLTGDEFALYSILDTAGDITPAELARWMAAPPTTVSSYVKRLEARGHVARSPNPDDRRSYRIELTPAGQQAHRRARRLFTPVRDQVHAATGEDHETVHRVLLDLRSTLDQLRHESP